MEKPRGYIWNGYLYCPDCAEKLNLVSKAEPLQSCRDEYFPVYCYRCGAPINLGRQKPSASDIAEEREVLMHVAINEINRLLRRW